jgi:hypothetical protein
VNLNKAGATMVSPLTFWPAATATKLRIDAAFETPAKELQVMLEPFSDQELRDWPCWGNKAKRPAKKWRGPAKLSIVGDGKFRSYELDLRAVPGYSGNMIRMKVRLPPGPGVARVRAIALTP